MKRHISLRLRVTVVCGFLLAVCCLLLTLSHTYYAYEMADAIEAVPLQPAQEVGAEAGHPPEELDLARISTPARRTFRTQSIAAMLVITVAGCWMVYWLTGKALSPLHRLDEQIRGRTAADLDQLLPVPSSGDEVAGLTESFNQMSQNLSKAFAQQKRFSQCAAHELRTPLTVLKTRMALFRKKGLCGTPETAELLDVLEDQTNRLSDLVSDLLALTNMDGVDCSEMVDVSALLARAVGNLQEIARAGGIELQMKVEQGVVRGNSLLLERAFFNLMENAVKYSRPNGVVEVCASCGGGKLRIEVSDQGIGIPEEFQTQIFEPFFRVDKSRSRQSGGAGLGLSLVRAIVELHNGEIWVESAPQRGSRFVVVLPAPVRATSGLA